MPEKRKLLVRYWASVINGNKTGHLLAELFAADGQSSELFKFEDIKDSCPRWDMLPSDPLKMAEAIRNTFLEDGWIEVGFSHNITRGSNDASAGNSPPENEDVPHVVDHGMYTFIYTLERVEEDV